MTKLIQITDCHLFADTSTLIKGLNTFETLQSVLADIDLAHSDADALLVTGDLSQDETLESYSHLKTLLDNQNIPYYWVLGNHDIAAEVIQAQFSDITVSPFILNHEHWLILCLNSRLDGEVRGGLGEAQFKWLTEQVCQSDRPIMLFLHHPITDTSSEAMNEHMLVEQQQLSELILNNPQIQAVFHGHLHHEMQKQVHQANVFSCPSTGYQYHLDFSTDDRPAGYRVIELEQNHYSTKVIRVAS